MQKTARLVVLFFLLAPVLSCRKDTLTLDTSDKIAFSTNSVLFDTVFTTIGSTTKYFMIYNNHANAIKISSIRLGAGSSSQYRINVDGVPATSFSDITIKGKDSLFVFVAVTVNPNLLNNPFVLKDSVVFTTNGNVQSVLLEAWGQNAYYYYPNPNYVLTFSDGTFVNYSIISCNAGNTTWSNDKPHVIYGYAVVDSGCTLTIGPGTGVYLHNGAVLMVYKGGSLVINGGGCSSGPTNPVTFQGDRLEADYKDIPGQWGQIWLTGGSVNNSISYAVIKNAIIGVEADTIGNANPTLVISHTIIKNMTGAAIYGQGATINGDNCVFANCQQYCGLFSIGGTYNFNQCTFADYWNGTPQRTTPALLINNWYTAANGTSYQRSIVSAYFGNCIIYGNLSGEIGLDSSLTINNFNKFNYMFDHCVLLADGTYNSLNPNHNDSIIENLDPLFKNPTINDYTIAAGSSAINKGSIPVETLFPVDLNCRNRISDGKRDIGAYEH